MDLSIVVYCRVSWRIEVYERIQTGGRRQKEQREGRETTNFFSFFSLLISFLMTPSEQWFNVTYISSTVDTPGHGPNAHTLACEFSFKMLISL